MSISSLVLYMKYEIPRKNMYHMWNFCKDFNYTSKIKLLLKICISDWIHYNCNVHCIVKPLYISFSLPFIQPRSFRSVLDYEHSCHHWKSDTAADPIWWASGLSDDGDIIGLCIFYKILQGNTRLLVNQCKPRLNVCIEQQNSRVGSVQTGIHIYQYAQYMYVSYTLKYQPLPA